MVSPTRETHMPFENRHVRQRPSCANTRSRSPANYSIRLVRNSLLWLLSRNGHLNLTIHTYMHTYILTFGRRTIQLLPWAHVYWIVGVFKSKIPWLLQKASDFVMRIGSFRDFLAGSCLASWFGVALPRVVWASSIHPSILPSIHPSIHDIHTYIHTYIHTWAEEPWPHAMNGCNKKDWC